MIELLLIISSGGLTGPHRLLPFLRFSRLYPRILVPPVLAGRDQDRLMQSLKALTTFGADGGPGYAVYTKVWELFLSLKGKIFQCIVGELIMLELQRFVLKNQGQDFAILYR